MACDSRIFDTATHDPGFFEDYQKAFENVSVICRMAQRDSIPEGAFRCDSRGVKFIGLPNLHGPLWAILGDRLSSSIAEKAASAADAMVLRVPGQIGWAAGRVARSFGKPYMVEVVGDPQKHILSLGSNPLYRLMALRYAHRLRILARHAAVASYVSSVGLTGAYPTGTEAPTLCISDIRLNPEQIARPRDYRVKGSRLRVIMVANLVGYKRHEDMLHATRRLLDGGSELEVRLVGDGPRRRRLEAISEKLHLRDHVAFHGHIADREALNRLLDGSDLFVMTSAAEGLPRAMIEAMARGLPVIASRAGGITELVDDTELFAVGHVDQLADLIGRLCSDPERLARLSAASVNKARAFTSDKLSSKRITLYRFLRDRVVRAGK